MANAGAATVLIAPRFSGFQRQIGQQMTGMGAEGEKAGRTLGSRLTGALTRVAKVGAIGAGVAIGAELTRGFTTGMDIQKSEATLRGLYGEGSNVTGMMKEIRNVSRSSPIDYTAYLKAAEAFGYMGLNTEEVPGILDNMGKAIVGVGGGSEHIDRATQSLLKMVNQGRVYSADLNQLSDTGIPIIDALAHHYGVTNEELKAMVSEGAVSVEAVTQVLQDADSPVFQQVLASGENVAKTLPAQFSILKDNIASSLGTMFQPGIEAAAGFLGRVNTMFAGEGGGFQVPNFAQPLVDSLTSLWDTAKTVGGQIAGAIGNIIEALMPLAKGIGTGAITALTWAFTALRPVISAVGAAIAWLGNLVANNAGAARALVGAYLAWRGIKLAVTIAQWTAGLIRNTITMLANTKAAIAARLAKMKDVATTGALVALYVRDAVVKAASTVATTANTVATRAAALAKGALNAILTGARALWVALTAGTIGNTVATGANRVATLASVAAQGVMRGALAAGRVAMIASTVAARGMGVAIRFMTGPIGIAIAAIGALVAGVIYAWNNFSWFRNAVTTVWNAIKTVIGAAVNWIVNTAKAVFSWFAPGGGAGGIFSWFGSLFGRVFGGIRNVAGSVLGWLGGFVTTIFGGIRSFLGPVLSWLGSLFSSIFNGIRNVVASVFNFIWTRVIRPIWNAIRAYFVAVFNIIKALFRGDFAAMRDITSNLMGKIRQVITNIWSAIRRWFSAALNAFVQFWQNRWRSISNFFSSIWQGIRRFFANIWNGIASWFTTALNVFLRGWRRIWNAVSSLFSSIWRGIRRFFTNIWNGIASWFTARLNNFLDGWRIIWSRVSNLFGNIWRGIRNTGQSIWGAISGFFTRGIESFRQTWANQWNKVKNAFEAVWNGIKQFGKSAWNGVLGVMGRGVNAVLRGVNWLLKRIDNIPGVNVGQVTLWKWEQHKLAKGGPAPGSAAGPVFGPGTSTSDSIPMPMLSAGEHVWTAREVDNFGGHNAMLAFRQQFGGGRQSRGFGFASGGTWLAGARNRHTSGYPWARWAGDIPKPMGTPVPAWKAGTVKHKQSLTSSYGKHLRISHGNEETLYAHLSRFLVNAGQKVQEAQAIGHVGSTGNALDVDTPVLTQNRGWVRHGDLTVGDVVLDENGLPTSITHVQHWSDRPTYRVTFDDGSTIDADENHLWAVYDSTEAVLVIDTKAIAADPGAKFAVVEGRAPNGPWLPRRYVQSVERIDNRNTNCITVDAESHLYLAGHNLVPTHNSTGPHLHFEIKGGSGNIFGRAWEDIKGAAGDVWNFLGNLSPVEWVSSLWKGIKDKVSGAFGDGLFKDLGLGPIKHAWDSVKEWILDKIGLGPGGDEGSANASAKPASQWRPQVMRALSMLGYPSSWAGATLKQIQIESGGDPNAINRWDINARRGTPSQGLLQTIPGTFQANKYPGYNNITGPLDNILAALRYTVRRYGSVPAIWPTRAGYDDGGWLPRGVTETVNQTRAPEAVLTSQQWKTAAAAIEKATQDAEGNGSGPRVVQYVTQNYPQQIPHSKATNRALQHAGYTGIV